jgi:hypothetical protein
MNIFLGPVGFFLITGNYLLFWPIYRFLHWKRTQRTQALWNLFLVELALYGCLTGAVLLAIYRVPDFHRGGLLLAELFYLFLVVVFWVATYGVWADNSPEPL